MFFHELPLAGAFVIELDLKSDPRGFFARTFDAKLMQERGLRGEIAQTSIAYNHQKGTVRGMHMQVPPVRETKLVRVTRGAIWDVIVDMRPGSPTYLRHVALELSADNRKTLYIPEMFAHGYQTLTDDNEISYAMSDFYTPGYERGYRHDDPALGIPWPLPVSVISDKDRAWPLLNAAGPVAGR